MKRKLSRSIVLSVVALLLVACASPARRDSGAAAVAASTVKTSGELELALTKKRITVKFATLDSGISVGTQVQFVRKDAETIAMLVFDTDGTTVLPAHDWHAAEFRELKGYPMIAGLIKLAAAPQLEKHEHPTLAWFTKEPGGGIRVDVGFFHPASGHPEHVLQVDHAATERASQALATLFASAGEGEGDRHSMPPPSIDALYRMFLHNGTWHGSGN